MSRHKCNYFAFREERLAGPRAGKRVVEPKRYPTVRFMARDCARSRRLRWSSYVQVRNWSWGWVR